MKKFFAFAAFLLMVSCGDTNYNLIYEEPEHREGESIEIGKTTEDEDTWYREPMRPQIHFTPAKNWINDPNGLVFADGIWHLYYQYNPYGHDWGNMSWGHATSTDLFHWKEQPVAIEPDQLGYIYSGSAVLDSL